MGMSRTTVNAVAGDKGHLRRWLLVAGEFRAVVLIKLKALEEEEARPSLIPPIRGLRCHLTKIPHPTCMIHTGKYVSLSSRSTGSLEKLAEGQETVVEGVGVGKKEVILPDKP